MIKTETNTFLVPVANLAKVQAKIAKFSKIAAKLNLAPVSLVLGPVTTQKLRGESFVRKFQEVTVSGQTPVLSDWKFVATLQHSHDAGAVVRTVPGETLPVAYRDANSHNCDHCHVNRFRTDTFVVKNVKTGEFKQVGSACIKDFLGHGDIKAILSWLELILSPKDCFGDINSMGPREKRYYEISSVLRHAACMIRLYGFTSKANATEQNESTGGRTQTNMYNFERKETTTSGEKLYDIPTTEDAEIAEKAMDWMKSVDSNGNEFLYNMTIIANDKDGLAEPRDVGILAAGVHSYVKSVAREKAKAEANKDALNEYVGHPGDKVEGEVKVVFHTSFLGSFGTTHMFTLLDKKGRNYTWFGSGSAIQTLSDLNKTGDYIAIKATIKKHQEYKGRKQTILTRLKIV